MTPLTTILIVLGIVTLWVWLFNQDNRIQPKNQVNLGILIVVTAWLIFEIIRGFV